MRRQTLALFLPALALVLGTSANAISFVTDPTASTVTNRTYFRVETSSGQDVLVDQDNTTFAAQWITHDFDPQPTPIGDVVLEGWDWTPPDYFGVIPSYSFGGEILLITGETLPFTFTIGAIDTQWRFYSIASGMWFPETSETMRGATAYELTTSFFDITLNVDGVIVSQTIAPTTGNGTVNSGDAFADLNSPVLGRVIRYEDDEGISIFEYVPFGFQAEVAGLTWTITDYVIMTRLTFIPEPSTALLLATGLAGLAAAGRRRSLH